MRSGGIGTPARCVSLPIDSTSSGCCSCKGRNLWNMGSMNHGLIKNRNSATGTAANQKYSHQRRGFQRITTNNNKPSPTPSAACNRVALLQSHIQEPQPCTDCS